MKILVERDNPSSMDAAVKNLVKALEGKAPGPELEEDYALEVPTFGSKEEKYQKQKEIVERHGVEVRNVRDRDFLLCTF